MLQFLKKFDTIPLYGSLRYNIRERNNKPWFLKAFGFKLMNHIGKNCPVCNTPFNNEDDIVVCPECGTPYHRVCYEKEGECIYKDMHGVSDFKNDSDEASSDNFAVCPVCGNTNARDALFCNKCGTSLTNRSNGNSYDRRNMMFDPMAGVNPEEILDNGITAGEAAKYVKVNTPYYIRVFSNISKSGKSKFNFAALLFSGGWMLYRKQYLKGAIITAIVAILMIGSTFLTYTYSGRITAEVFEAAGITSQYTASDIQAHLVDLSNAISALPIEKKLMYWLPMIMDISRYTISIIIGFTANRRYYKHCMDEITSIKQANADNELKASEALQTSGGVNTKIAICLLVCLMIINYLPMFLS